MFIPSEVYQAILAALPLVPPEAGVVLGARDNRIAAFVVDTGIPKIDRAVYTPRTDYINQVIRQWHEKGIQFCGLAHSHPFGQNSLSRSDIAYIHSIMKALPASVAELYFPLVFPGREIISFVAERRHNEIEIYRDNIIFIS